MSLSELYITEYLSKNNLISFKDVKTVLTSEKFNLKVKEDKMFPNLYLVSYFNKSVELLKNSKMDDEMVQECRGIILEKETNKVVCHSFPKSCDDLKKFEDNWDNVEIEESIDGTQIRLFNYNGRWNFATTRCINALKAKFYGVKSFYEMFNEASLNLNYDNLDKKCCYSFVLCYPQNRIVVAYEKPIIYHTHTRNLETMDEVSDVVIPGVLIPNKVEFKTMDLLVNSVKNEKNINKEGYILKLKTDDGKFLRYKMKTDVYKKVRELRGNNNNILFDYFRFYTTDTLNQFIYYYPEYSNLFMIFSKNVNILVNLIHKEYMEKNVHKTITYETMTWHFKPTIYKIHKIHITTKEKTTKQTIREYLYTLAPAQLCFLYNKTFI